MSVAERSRSNATIIVFIGMPHFGCRSMTGIKDKSLREKSNKLTQIKQKDFLKDLIIFDEFHSHNETHRVRM